MSVKPGRGSVLPVSDQHSARCDIHEVRAIARPANDTLIGLRLVGRLEPMVDTQPGRGTAIDNGDHGVRLASLATRHCDSSQGAPLSILHDEDFLAPTPQALGCGGIEREE